MHGEFIASIFKIIRRKTIEASLLFSFSLSIALITSEGRTIYILYIYYESYDEVQNNKKCTSTNINESKSDMHDQGDLEIQLIISLSVI
jgi:hypothetical protein